MARRTVRTLWQLTDSAGTVVARYSPWREAITECDRRNRELGRREYSVETQAVTLRALP